MGVKGVVGGRECRWELKKHHGKAHSDSIRPLQGSFLLYCSRPCCAGSQAVASEDEGGALKGGTTTHALGYTHSQAHVHTVPQTP